MRWLFLSATRFAFPLALISVCWESKTKRELLTFDSGDV